LSTVVKIVCAIVCCCVLLGATAAQRDLVYTYIGPVAGAGMNRVVYSDWNNLYGKKIISGYYTGGGVSFWVMSKWLIGDFTLQYRYNKYDNERVLHHLYFTMSGRVGIPLGSVAILAPGVGIYIDTPPSNRKFNGGAGLRVPLAVMFNTTFDTKLYLEGSFLYGWYGMGDKSEKLSYGVNLGFIIKVGRI
jgi:hypothetical protein